MLTGRSLRRLRWAVVPVALALLLPVVPTGVAAAAPVAPSASASLDLGSGFVRVPNQGSRWVAAHPNDARTARIKAKIVSRSAALWLTGPESYANLTAAVQQARTANGTLVLSLYDIPQRWDGISAPSAVTAAQYRAFVDKVTATLGSTRAAVVIEPDALWFVDRLTPAGSAAYTVRMASLKYAVKTFAAKAPGSRVYLDAGTSSGSVTPDRMAALLSQAGIAKAAGYALNVSSFAPNGAVEAYADAIRARLQSKFGIADPRFVVDTSRNGNPVWNNTWCNPTGRKIGVPPAVYSDPGGLDATLWVKAPGASDGDCGNGAGSTGGQFLPDVAYAQAG